MLYRVYRTNMREIALWPFANGAIPYFIVLPGNKLSITEITDYKYFGLLKPSREFRFKSELNIVTLVLIIEPIFLL